MDHCTFYANPEPFYLGNKALVKMVELQFFPFRNSSLVAPGGKGLTKGSRPHGSDLATALSEAFDGFQQSGSIKSRLSFKTLYRLVAALPPSHPRVTLYLLSTFIVFFSNPSSTLITFHCLLYLFLWVLSSLPV